MNKKEEAEKNELPVTGNNIIVIYVENKCMIL